jgi:hypothetical protein
MAHLTTNEGDHPLVVFDRLPASDSPSDFRGRSDSTRRRVQSPAARSVSTA